uniref:NADH dehydrogenase (Ubiquinone) complex I, assembly factor 6 n=1 Tax=Angiostrongylus cantonensis TaxID=6313 RepID=A0A0K0DFG4_ANGCA
MSQNRDRSWDEAGSCMSFITFEHRGKAMSPAHAIVRQRTEEVAQLVKSRDRENYQAALTMTRTCRAEVFALLAFNVEVAVVREKISSQRGANTAGMYRLQFWRDTLSSIYGDSVSPIPRPFLLQLSRQPVAIALCSFAPHASLTLLESLVVARQQTMGDRPFSTIDSVTTYGIATTGALIRLEGEALVRGCAIGKPPKEFAEAADELGAAYGIMNVIRSFLPLLTMGIVLLPADLLELHSLTPDRVYKRKDHEAVTRLVRDMVQVALTHIRASNELSSSIPRVLCPSLAAPACVVENIIRNAKKVNYNIYDPILQKQHPFLIWSLLVKKFLVFDCDTGELRDVRNEPCQVNFKVQLIYMSTFDVLNKYGWIVGFSISFCLGTCG